MVYLGRWCARANVANCVRVTIGDRLDESGEALAADRPPVHPAWSARLKSGPGIPGQAGYFKRRRRLTDTLEWLMECFASQSPGFYDDLSLVDSTPLECCRSRETVMRSHLADAADYGYSL